MKKMILIITCIVGCSADLSDNNKKDIADVGRDSNVEKDVIIEKDTEQDIEEIDVNEIENDWTFFMRKPRAEVLTCDDEKWPDSDWLCSFEYEGKTGTIYSRNTPTTCASAGITIVPNYGSRLFGKIGDSVMEFSNAGYDIGGGHQNDFITFDYREKTVKYFHSSFGFGFRKCQPMDCIQVYDKNETLELDGCTSERSLPIVCVQVKADGAYTDASFVDSFMKCAGDDS